MNLRIGLLIAATVLVAALLIVLFVWPALLIDRTGRALIGKPLVKPIATLVAPEDLNGTSFILISDMYDHECNERYSEFSDLVEQLHENGTNARMLHIGSHGSPSESYEDAVDANRGPTHIVIADASVAYSDGEIRRLRKPCLLELSDGNVINVRTGADFEEWISSN